MMKMLIKSPQKLESLRIATRPEAEQAIEDDESHNCQSNKIVHREIGLLKTFELWMVRKVTNVVY